MATKTKEELARLVADFLETPNVPKVTEKDREARCLAFLDQVCGPGDEILIGHLAEISQGATGRDVLKGDRLVTVYPSANERTNAARLLRVWHRGLAQRSVKVDQTITHRVKWDPDRLSLQELEQLEATHARAALPEGRTVDAEFSETADPIQEKAENQGNSENPEDPESED